MLDPAATQIDVCCRVIVTHRVVKVVRAPSCVGKNPLSVGKNQPPSLFEKLLSPRFLREWHRTGLLCAALLLARMLAVGSGAGSEGGQAGGGGGEQTHSSVPL